MNETHPFEYEKLDVCQVLREFLTEMGEIAAALPRGESHLSNQLRRAGDSAMLNYCEGAGRFAPREKAHLYDIARGSVTECCGGLDVIQCRRLLPATRLAHAWDLGRRAACMLTKLAGNWRARA